MIIYFADRGLNIKGQASTSLMGGLRIYSDVTVEDIDSGVNTFECKVWYNSETRESLENAAQVGNFILKGSGTAYDDAENTYDSVYQIISTEFDTLTQELSLYAEDAGLDLINKVVPEAVYEDKTLEEMLTSVLPSDWTLNLVGTPTVSVTYGWDGENTATERINSICYLFGCECYYSFVIERFEVTAKVLNVTPKRGNQEAIPQLRLNKDINRIVTKTSIADMATALSVVGAIPNGKKKPINLKGYEYEYEDPYNGDLYQVDQTTGQMRNVSAMARWSSILDTDGLILKRFSFETTKKAELAGQARAALQEITDAAVNYEVDISILPDNARIGDRINIIDEDEELYLEARLLRLETSVSDNSIVATIGEFIMKDSGISDSVRAIAQDVMTEMPDGADAVTIAISSSGGNIFHNTAIATTLSATIFTGDTAITTQSALESAFGSGAAVKWYNANAQLAGTGFTLSVSDVNDMAIYTVRLEV